MELRKCCNHPYLLKGVEADNTSLRGAKPQAVVDAMVEASGKLALIDKMFARLKELGHRTLIYSQFTTVLDILEDWLVQRGWGFQRIDGEVSESFSTIVDCSGMPSYTICTAAGESALGGIKI
jgi:SNF2 family DNA or RNA helicase